MRARCREETAGHAAQTAHLLATQVGASPARGAQKWRAPPCRLPSRGAGACGQGSPRFLPLALLCAGPAGPPRAAAARSSRRACAGHCGARPSLALRRAGSCLDPLCVAGGPERRRGGRPARRAIPSTAVRARCVHGAAGRWAPAGASPCSSAGTGLGELLDAHGEASGRERGYAGHSRRGSPALPL